MADTQAAPTTGFSGRVRGYVELMRPANVVTALADVLAGVAAAGLLANQAVFLSEGPAIAALLLSTSALYAGGVVFNDVFDATLDAEERPERPIPSGRVSKREAAYLGGILLGIGVIAAGFASFISAGIAVLIAVCAVFYDAYGKHYTWFGPINMGLCRGLNLLLGLSLVPAMMISWAFLAIIPIIYIAAITAISQGEVHGGTRFTGWLACGLVLMVLSALLGLGIYDAYSALMALPFVIVLAVQVLPAFVRAATIPEPDRIRSAVKSGVIALITVNAALASGFAGWMVGLVVLALTPISMLLAGAFKVT